MRTVLARTFSTLGHPVVVTPIAGIAVAQQQGMGAPALRSLAIGLAALAVIVLAYSWRQVRAGHWNHVDASARGERQALNVFLSVLLCGAALAAWLTTRRPEVSIALALLATLVLAALLCGRWLKLSLHVGFAAFASALLWPEKPWVLAMLALTVAIGWSRLELQRHSRVEVIVAMALGLLAGCAYHAGVVALHR